MIQIKHILRYSLLVIGLAFALTLVASKVSVYAETIQCADNSVHDVEESDTANGTVANLCADNGGVKAGATTQSSNTSSTFSDSSCSSRGSSDQCIIFKKYLLPLINLLTAGVGLIVTIMIVIGGIQYTTSGGNAQGVSAAKQRIFNALLALLSFALLWALLQWIVPGGLFK